MTGADTEKNEPPQKKKKKPISPIFPIFKKNFPDFLFSPQSKFY